MSIKANLTRSYLQRLYDHIWSYRKSSSLISYIELY